MKTNKGILSDEELKERTSFWNKKKQFRTWTKKELNRDAAKMQKLLAAIKDLTVEEIYAEQEKRGGSLYGVYIKDIEYTISIAPKTFKCKKG